MPSWGRSKMNHLVECGAGGGGCRRLRWWASESVMGGGGRHKHTIGRKRPTRFNKTQWYLIYQFMAGEFRHAKMSLFCDKSLTVQYCAIFPNNFLPINRFFKYIHILLFYLCIWMLSCIAKVHKWYLFQVCLAAWQDLLVDLERSSSSCNYFGTLVPTLCFYYYSPLLAVRLYLQLYL